MKTKTVLRMLILLSFPAGHLRAQSLDGAVDARVDGLSPADAARSDAATDAPGGGGRDASGGGGGSGGSKDAGLHDAAPPPPIKFFLNESPGCSIGGSTSPVNGGGALLGVALVVFALLRRRPGDSETTDA
jgi:uncharacterized protein (TIGR03382 family)